MTEIVRIYDRRDDEYQGEADIGPDGRLIRGDADKATVAMQFLEERSVDDLLSYLDGPHRFAVAIDIDDLEYDPGLQEKSEPLTRKDFRLSKDWIRYQGPFGGEGWQNVQTGEVRYVDDPPGEVAQEGQVQTTLPGEGYEITVDAPNPQWLDSPDALESVIAETISLEDSEFNNPTRLDSDEPLFDDAGEAVRHYWQERSGRFDDLREYGTGFDGFLEATQDWIEEFGNNEMAGKLQERLQEYNGVSPWGENNAPDHLNPENAERVVPLSQTKANRGVSASAMMVADMPNGERVYITNVNEDLKTHEISAEFESDVIAAKEAADFLQVIGSETPEHYYEPGEFLAVAEANGTPLRETHGRLRHMNEEDFAAFAAKQLIAGNDDAHSENVFYGRDDLVCIDLDLAGKNFAQDSGVHDEFSWALGTIIQSGHYTGVFDAYDEDDQQRMVDKIQREAQALAESDRIEEALDQIEDSEVREAIEANVMAARNGELFDEEQKVSGV